MTPFESEMVRQGLVNLWIQGVIAVGAFLVAGLAIWGDRLKVHWFGPQLSLSMPSKIGNHPVCTGYAF
jgi:hypothetical protein